VGIGADVNRQGDGAQVDWVKDYDLNRYPGKVLPDGVRAMVDVIMKSRRPVTVIAIGPVPNLALALRMEPRIAERARLVGMHGSVRVGYGGSKDVHAEYNVKEDPKSCREAFEAAWPITITPLDTCGLVDLRDGKYRRFKESADPIARAILENYRVWADRGGDGPRQAFPTRSSTLFDTVAVYLAVDESLVTMEELGIRVADDGFTRMEAGAKRMWVATAWKDKAGFEDWMLDRLVKR
jgi:inosine-uridine nucleoside N-ribohydrolase